MQRRVFAATIGLVLTLSLTTLVSGCQSADANGRDDSAPGSSDGSPVSGEQAPSGGAAGTQTAPHPAASVSGLPPPPDTETRARYAAALDAIDPRIVGGDADRAVERGRTTCRSIAAHMNHTKLIAETKQKFGHTGYTVSTAHAEGIVRAANTHLCPSYGA